ncbi:MAG: glutamate racemase [Saprospiraceae bacterium]|nr:glutamate racemase [Saprospiraceae bacterium]
MKKDLPIGFFDSGIGGLTVLYEALRMLPHERYIYYADSDRAPYGTRPKDEVRTLALHATDFIVDQGVKALVIACNTATSAAIGDMRQRYKVPVIGMEPAVKPAVTHTGDPKRVLVFATELTLKEAKFRELVARVDTRKQVDFLPLQELVLFAERFEFDEQVILPYLKMKLQAVNLNEYSTIVLGCTHFIYFKKIMEQVIPPDVRIIDGNRGTVLNLKNRLGECLNDGPGGITYFLSDQPKPAAYFEKYLRLLEPASAKT